MPPLPAPSGRVVVHVGPCESGNQPWGLGLATALDRVLGNVCARSVRVWRVWLGVAVCVRASAVLLEQGGRAAFVRHKPKAKSWRLSLFFGRFMFRRSTLDVQGLRSTEDEHAKAV